jgi:hypothetical protein
MKIRHPLIKTQMKTAKNPPFVGFRALPIPTAN